MNWCTVIVRSVQWQRQPTNGRVETEVCAAVQVHHLSSAAVEGRYSSADLGVSEGAISLYGTLLSLIHRDIEERGRKRHRE